MAVYSRSIRRELGRNPEAVGVGSLFVVLFAVHAWSALVGSVGYRQFDALLAIDRFWAFVFPIFLVQVVGVAGGAFLYARARNHPIPFGVPDRNRLRVVGAVAAAPVALIALTALAGYALDATVSEMAQMRYSPEVQLSFLVYTSFVPAVLRGVGYGLLFFGVVHERLRDVASPRHALVLTPVVAGFFHLLSGESLLTHQFDPIAVLHFLTLLLVGVAFGACVGLLYRGTTRDSLPDVLRFAYVPVFVIGLLGFVGVAMELAELPTGAVDALWLATFAVAAYGYERARSVWVPVAVVAVFAAALDVAAVLEAVAGIAPPV